MYQDYMQEIEAKEEALFKEKYTKQVKIMRRVFLIVFVGIGVIFATLGGVFLSLQVMDQDGFLIGIPFLILGGVFLLMGIIFTIAMPSGEKLNYEKMKARMNKNGGAYMASNSIYLSTILAVQKEQIKDLAIKVTQLEDDVRRLRNERRT